MAKACITVLAGTNGAGKSSVGGAFLSQSGVPFFNPDDVAREISKLKPNLTPGQVNSLAWHEGLQQLQEAIRLHHDYAFETTLGGNTIAFTLEEALDAGMAVQIWYVGLETPELHIARVQARVARGGHPIPEEKIRQRFITSQLNLIGLLPRLDELKVFDNSAEEDPASGKRPEPRLLLHTKGGAIIGPTKQELEQTPEWAKAIVTAALPE